MTENNFLLVDDDPNAIRMMHKVVSSAGHTRFATNGPEALRLAHEAEPNLILLDAEMPGMSGFQVIDQLKLHRQLRDVPVVMVTAHDNEAFQLAGFQSGVADFIVKPLNPNLALARIMSLLQMRQQAKATARLLTVDPVTELANWRGFSELLYREWRRSLRCSEPICALILEVDNFEAMKAAVGSPGAEQCMNSVGQRLKRLVLQPDDVIGRISQRAFGILLPSTDRTTAKSLVHRIVEDMRDLDNDHTAGQVSVSIGGACFDSDSASWTVGEGSGLAVARPIGSTQAWMLLKAADRALRLAKAGGAGRSRMIDIADIVPAAAPSGVATASRPTSPSGLWARGSNGLRKMLGINLTAH